jgi:hypothetical protein
MNVLVIPEDFTNDQNALQPIIEAMMTAIGKPKAKVKVCTDPRLGGVEQALKWEKIQPILDRYSMVDIFLLCVDRDGKPSRRAELDHLTKKAQSFLTDKYQNRCKFIAECAWQELEVWILAGQKDLPRDWSWKEIRAEPDPKEKYCDVYAKQRAKSQGVAGGRKLLAIEAAKRYDRIRKLCPEDIGSLETNIQEWLARNN